MQLKPKNDNVCAKTQDGFQKACCKIKKDSEKE